MKSIAFKVFCDNFSFFNTLTQLASRFATQNVIRCSFSIDSQCFTEKKTEFREMGKKIFQPTFWGGFKLMMMSICPILRDVIPFAFVPADVDTWFQRLVRELREERKRAPLQQEDLFQMILNSVDKYSNALMKSFNKSMAFYILI